MAELETLYREYWDFALESNPLIAPVSPEKTFVLPEEPTQLFWRTNFELRKPVKTKKPRRRIKKRRGPTAI